MEDYQEFLNKLQKRGSNKYHISHCLGSRDAWKWVRKNKWECLKGQTCTSTLYSNIISTVNRMLAEQLLEGHEIEFPHQMGSLKLISVSPIVKNINGKIVTNYRTDWKKTLELWFTDKEARESHLPIKRVQNKIYHIRYNKKKAVYLNKSIYDFRLNRSLVRKLGEALERGKILTEAVEYNN